MDVHGVQSFRRAGQTLGPTHWGRRQRSVFGSFLLISPAGAVESDQKPPRAPSISSGLCPSPTLETSGIWNPMRGSASPSLLHLTSEALRKRAPSRALGGLLWSTRARGAALGSPKLMGRSECFQEIPLPSARPRCRPMTPFSSIDTIMCHPWSVEDLFEVLNGHLVDKAKWDTTS